MGKHGLYAYFGIEMYWLFKAREESIKANYNNHRKEKEKIIDNQNHHVSWLLGVILQINTTSLINIYFAWSCNAYGRKF